MKTNNQIKEGDVIEGRITGVQTYGIFIKLNDECNGLVHSSELGKLENDNLNRFFKIGQPLKVKILRIKPGGKQAVLRIHRTPANRRRMGASSFETNSGFSAVKKQMTIWIQDAKDNDYVK